MRVEIIEDIQLLSTSQLIIKALDPDNKMKYKRIGKLSYVDTPEYAIRVFQSKIDSSYITVQKDYYNSSGYKVIYGLNMLDHIELIKSLSKEAKKIYGNGDECGIYLDVCTKAKPNIWICGPDGGLLKTDMSIDRLAVIYEDSYYNEFQDLLNKEIELDLGQEYDLEIHDESLPYGEGDSPTFLFICNSNVIDF